MLRRNRLAIASLMRLPGSGNHGPRGTRPRARADMTSLHDSPATSTRRARRSPWTTQYQPFSEEQNRPAVQQRSMKRAVATGELPPTASKKGGDTSYEFKGVRPTTRSLWALQLARKWRRWTPGSPVLQQHGPALQSSTTLDERPEWPPKVFGRMSNRLAPTAHERIGYATQKPEAVLERIISASQKRRRPRRRLLLRHRDRRVRG